MKKYITSALLVAGLILNLNIANANSSYNRMMQADVEAISIPTGTVLNLELLTPISTQVGSVGDEFSAMLKEDKIVKGKIVLPAGTLIRGTISKITPAKRLSRSALLYINFDHVVTPTGRQLPISAGIYNYQQMTLDGGIYKNGNYGYAIQENWANAKKIFKRTVDWGKGTGENMQYVCVPVGAFGGVVGGAGYYIGNDIADLFRKGNEVNLNQGKDISILLTQPIDVPLY